MPLKKLTLLFAAIFYLGVNGFSQQVQEPKMQWVYEFSVTGMTSARDAQKIDTTIAKMVGIYSCKTNFATQKTVVTCRPTIGYFGLRVLVDMAGFYAEEIYIDLREEERVVVPKEEEKSK